MVITNNYDKTIVGFWQMFRFVYIFSLFIVLAFAYLCINHGLFYPESFSEFCGGNMPCFLLESRFAYHERARYATTIFAYCIVGMSVCIYQLIQLDYQSKYQQVNVEDGIVYARKVFNAVNWQIDDPEDAQDQKSRIANEIKLALDEAIIREKVKDRTKKQWSGLYVRRFFSITLSILLIFVGWGGIGAASLYEGELGDFGAKLHPLLVSFLDGNVVEFLVADPGCDGH